MFKWFKTNYHTPKFMDLDDHEQFGTRTIHDDPINPSHYKSTGVECIEVAEAFPYSIGNAIKYAWRAGLKDDLLQDLLKCQWYIERACERHDYATVDTQSRDYYVALYRCKEHLDNLKEKTFTQQEALIDSLVILDLGNARSLIDRAITELKVDEKSLKS